MRKILFLVLCSQAFCVQKEESNLDNDRRALAAAKNARYYFSSYVIDQVNDATSHRKELRLGQQVVGSFSYSDGFIERQVLYAADQNGYRVISDKMEHLTQPQQEKQHNFSSTYPSNSTHKTKSSK